MMTIDSDSGDDNYDLQPNVVSFYGSGSWGVAWDEPQKDLNCDDPAHEHLINLKEHVCKMATNCEGFTKNEKRMINLLHILVHNGAPLSTTDAVMEWHLAKIGKKRLGWVLLLIVFIALTGPCCRRSLCADAT